jgi:5-methylcytosine-specific restriction endonuclease McrA
MDVITRAQAREAGWLHYFTGKPCPAGHVSPRQVSNGACTSCAKAGASKRYAEKRSDPNFKRKNAERSLANYNGKMSAHRSEKAKKLADQIAWAYANFPDRNVRTKLEATAAGLTTYFIAEPCRQGHIADRRVVNSSCIECVRSRIARWRRSHIEHISAYGRDYYARDPEARREWARHYHAGRADNPFYKERNRIRTSVWIAKNPEKHKHNVNLRRARKKAAPGTYTLDDAKRIRKAQKDSCGYCRKNLRGGGELDHIVALARGGTNLPSNLQWLCKPCNRKKHARDHMDFARSLGRLL